MAHDSELPISNDAVTHLSGAVQRVGTWQTPMRLNDTTRTYFEKLATISSPEKAARYKDLVNPQRTAAAQRYLAVLHTVVVEPPRP